MTRMTTSRWLVAVATVLGLVALSTAPAGAVTPDDVSGTITTGGDDVWEVPGDNPCASTDLDVAFVGDDTSGTWTVDGTIKVPFTFFTAKLQAEITFLPPPLPPSGGTYTRTGVGPPHSYDLAGTLNLQATIDTLDKDEGCAKANLCVLRARVIVDPAQSTFDGTLPAPGSTDVMTVVATSETTGGIRWVAVGGSCPVTITSLFVGQTVDLDLVLTDW